MNAGANGLGTLLSIFHTFAKASYAAPYITTREYLLQVLQYVELENAYPSVLDVRSHVHRVLAVLNPVPAYPGLDCVVLAGYYAPQKNLYSVMMMRQIVSYGDVGAQ